MFEHINTLAGVFLDAGDPVISVGHEEEGICR